MADPIANPIPLDVLRELFTVDETSKSGIRWLRDGTAIGARYKAG